MNFSQTCASKECTLSNTSYAVRNSYTRQETATNECTLSYGCNTVRNSYATRNAFRRQNNFCQGFVTQNAVVARVYFVALRYSNVLKALTPKKHVISNTCHTIGDSYTCQRTTNYKRRISDARHFIFNSYAR